MSTASISRVAEGARGDPRAGSVLKTDGGYAYDQATWAPWDIPSLM